jgi:hypothetical protein
VDQERIFSHKAKEALRCGEEVESTKSSTVIVIERNGVKPRDPLRCGGEARSAIVRALRGWVPAMRDFAPLTMTIAIEQDN